MSLEALKKLKTVKKAEKKKKEEKIIVTGKKQTDSILLEENIMREKLQQITKMKRTDRFAFLDSLLKERDVFFTRKPFIAKFKLLPVYLQNDFIKKYIKQPQKYLDYYNIWFSEQVKDDQEDEKEERKRIEIKEDRYKEIQKYIYNNALEYAKKLGIETEDERNIIKNLINFEINAYISTYILDNNINVELDPEDIDYNVKIILDFLLKPLKKILKEKGLNIYVCNQLDLNYICNQQNEEYKNLIENILKKCKNFLNFLKDDNTEYKDILAKVNHIIDHPHIFLEDIKNKKMYEINRNIYGIYIDISKLLNISDPEKLSINHLTEKICKKEKIYFSRNQFLELKNNKELLLNKANNLGLSLENEPEEIVIIKILLATSKKQYQIPLISERKTYESKTNKNLREQIQYRKIDEKAIIIAKDFLSSTLLKISPYMIDYKPESKYIDDVLKESIKQEPYIYDFFLDMSDLCIYILLEKAVVFKDRIKYKYYIPEILLQLSPFDKLPEIFNSDNNIKAQELFSSYIDNKKNIFVAQMINSYINTTKEDIIHKWKTYVTDFTKRKPLIIEKSIENELLLESEYTDFDFYGKCENKGDVINEPVHNLVYYNDENDNKMYCFKIPDLMKNIKENKKLVNQYNGYQIKDSFINSIKNKYNIYCENDETIIEKKANENELKILQMQHKNIGLFEIKLAIPNLWDLVNQSIKNLEEEQEEKEESLKSLRKREEKQDIEQDNEEAEESLKSLRKREEEKEEKEEKKEKEDVEEKKEKNTKHLKTKKKSPKKFKFTSLTNNKCCICGKEQINFKSIEYNGKTVYQLNFCSTDCMSKKTFKKR